MWRCLPRMTGLDASPLTSSTPSQASEPPPTSTLGRLSASRSPSVRLASSVTSLSSQVPALFHAEPAAGLAASASRTTSAAICAGLNSFLPSSGFHSRCLYHVRLSSVSTTFSSSLRFLSPSSEGGGGFLSSVFAFGASGFLHTRLWYRQSSFWHCAEQYSTFLQMPHRSGLEMSLWQLWQWGFSAGLADAVADSFGFSSSESSMLSNFE
mmetsp:Transcript_99831/g.308002  ORF Transcript_99831/g.308002 Transcript_99831/m.308002 type:complete len:210 (+) Transcript_99831:404-1033(+)